MRPPTDPDCTITITTPLHIPCSVRFPTHLQPVQLKCNYSINTRHIRHRIRLHILVREVAGSYVGFWAVPCDPNETMRVEQMPLHRHD
jgi:hypothetical protein